MATEVNNEPRENSEMLFSLSELMRKMPQKIPPHKCQKREPNIKSDLKPYFEDDHLENLRANCFRQGEGDACTEAMMRSIGMIYLSPNMCKRNSKPRGNTKKAKGCICRIYTTRASIFSPLLPD